jgi:hypothetical protein
MSLPLEAFLPWGWKEGNSLSAFQRMRREGK